MTTKRFVKLQFIFVILLTLTLICGTYSWASRPMVTGGNFMNTKKDDHFAAMEFITEDYYVNGVECTAKTYRGTVGSDGKVTYDEETNITSVKENELAANSPIYFKTVITNAADIPTNVSLYISGKFNQDIQSSFAMGITSPIAYSGTFDVVYNSNDSAHNIAYDFNTLLSQYEIDASGTANIEWYIINNNQDGTAGYFEISEIILTNN